VDLLSILWSYPRLYNQNLGPTRERKKGRKKEKVIEKKWQERN
jgi:hypothetical protein